MELDTAVGVLCDVGKCFDSFMHGGGGCSKVYALLKNLVHVELAPVFHKPFCVYSLYLGSIKIGRTVNDRSMHLY